MKKNVLLLLLLLCVVLIFGAIFLYNTQFRPRPQVECEAARPVVSFHGIVYVSPSQSELTHSLSVQDLGTVVGVAGDGAQAVQSNCGLLNPGEQVYRLKNYQPSFRLAVRTSNGLSFFEVGDNPQAKTGNDLFDISGKVQFITIAPIDNPESATHTIHDPVNVQKLVNELLSAPTVAHCSLVGQREVLLFHLQDGSVLQTNYWSSAARLGTGLPQCVQLPSQFAAQLSGSN